MMKVKQIASLLVSLGATVAMSYAQSVPATLRESATSKYDYSEAFAPFFYTKNGSEYRTAGGKPGYK